MQSVTDALSKRSRADADIVQADLFDALFPIGKGVVEMTRFAHRCSQCNHHVAKTTGGFEIDPMIVGRTYKVARAFCKPSCLPQGDPSRLAWEALGPGAWYSWNLRTGADARELGHPWDLRELSLWEEAILALDPGARQNETLITALRAAFEAPDSYYDPTVGRAIYNTTQLPLPDGSVTTLGAILHQHQDELCVPLLTTTSNGEQTVSLTFRPVDLCTWILDLCSAHAA